MNDDEAFGRWREIITAPKDGSLVRVRRKSFAPFHARWKDGEWQAIEYSAEGVRPTHWLPEPFQAP